MGVLGLWQLLAPVGQPVTLESLENKIFAVDISIWLNQAVKGYRDSTGGSVPNAHLLSLFSRLCKLLFYKIRPIIVFDGGFPELKKQTIINRQQRRAAAKQNSRDFGLKILSNYLASRHLGPDSDALNFKSSFRNKEKPREEIFKLLPLPESSQATLSDSYDGHEDYEPKFTNFTREDIRYLNQIDLESEDFNALPLDVKQEILSTLKESRKQTSWDQYNDLPRESGAFSEYQMRCLLKKRKLQSKLEQVQRDMRQANSSAYVSQYTSDHVIGEANKIMSDDTSYYVLLKKIKHSEEHSKCTEDIKPGVCVMANTKKAFIEDIEKIEFSSDSDSEVSNEDCAQTVVKKSETTVKSEADTSRLSNQYDDIEFLESETRRAVPEIKREVDSLDLSDEEDVDNPPLLWEETHRNIDENTGQNVIPAGDDRLSSSNVTMGSNNQDRPECKANVERVLPGAENVLESKTEVSVVAPIEQSAACHEMNQNHHGASVQNPKIKPQLETRPTAGECDDNSESNVVRRVSQDEASTFNGDAGTSLDYASDSSLTIDNEANLRFENNLRAETAVLEAEQAKIDRQSSTVQDHMVEECKELLRLFGVPYVVSPSEAEAQCAFYDSIGFTHGTITDDSDAWLFGGKRIYKNFFAQQKFVECYKDTEIFSHFGLSREKLIHFALLTGSDYTEGVEGVGPVTATEIISEFPGEGLDALRAFKEWWSDARERKRPPENRVRAKLLRLVLPESFPDERVFEAYLRPEVDTSEEKFTWGRPDLDAIRDYARERFGWGQGKVDGQLLPVLKRLSERERQTRLDGFFTATLRKERDLFPSKRIMSALRKITSPQKQEANTKAKVMKRRPAPKKGASSKRGVGTKTRRQGPDLSEESSSDGDR